MTTAELRVALGSVVPDPTNGSYTASPGRRWLRIGISNSTTGFWAGWSCFTSVEPAMIILGLGARQTVL
jgi:hypothetical protein